MPTGFFIVADDLRVRGAGGAVRALTGHDAADLTDLNLGDVLSIPTLETSRQRLEAGEDSVTFEHRDAAGGRPLHVSMRSLTLDGSAGVLVLVDVPRGADARSESTRLYTDRLDSVTKGPRAIVWEADRDRARCTFVTESAEEILGYPRTQWLTQERFWMNLLHPDDRERAVATASGHLSPGERREHAYRVMALDGRIVWIQEHIHALERDGLGAETRGVMVDVTDRREAEEERTRLISAVEQSTESIMMTTRDGVIVYVNPAFERSTGYTAADAAGQTPRLLRSGKQDWRFYQHLWRTILAGRVWSGELINRRKDGSVYAERLTIAPVRQYGGEITHFIASAQDITERRELEEQLRQSQKIEAIGRLAGGIAHDFSNLLTVVSGHSERLLRGLDEGDPLHKGADAIKKAAERATSLTQQLLAFSRRQMLAPRVLDLNAVVASIDHLLRRLIGEDIVLTTLPSAGLGRVRADPSQIEQVLMNLAVNARDAMPQGGTLLIETSDVELDDAYSREHVAVVPGGYVMLAVTDTGLGMDPETRSRVFEPFFTTKEQGKGTGLGLSTVYGIVKQSGGYVWVYSELDHGTTFKVYLPRVDEVAESVQPEAPRSSAPRGSETILLVEDEPGVRELVREILESYGYRVLDAADATTAIALATEHAHDIHLLVTDVVMPQMGGRELAERLTSQRPSVRVLYMSGYTDSAIVHHGVLDRTAPFLAKPFSRDALARKVRDVLDQTRG